MWNEEKLNELLTTPSLKLIEDVRKIRGDIMILGAGGKMGNSKKLTPKESATNTPINAIRLAEKRFLRFKRVPAPSFLDKSAFSSCSCCKLSSIPSF